MFDWVRGTYRPRTQPELLKRKYSMLQVQHKVRTTASLHVVFNNGAETVAIPAVTTLGELAQVVRAMSARRHSHAATIDVVFAGQRTGQHATRAQEFG